MKNAPIFSLFRQFSVVFMLFIGILGLNACSTLQLDTLEKRIAAFEISYQEVLKTIVLYRDEGRYDAATWAEIQKVVREVKIARESMRIALDLSDYDLAGDKLILANEALSALRAYYIRQDESQQKSSYHMLGGYSDNHLVQI